MKARMAKMVFVLVTLVFLGVNYARAAETWLTLNKPEAKDTYLRDISGSNAVGWYNDALGSSRGFFYDGTSWTTLDMPGANDNMVPWSVSGSNIVGQYWDASYNLHSFFYDGKNWETFVMPGDIRHTVPLGIDGNNIVGYYQTTAGGEHGFFYDGTSWTDLDAPVEKLLGQNGFLISGIRPFGISGNNIVGSYEDNTDYVHGFLYDILKKSYTTLDVPGATYTQLLGIDGNNVVGNYRDASFDKADPSTYLSSSHGFLYDILKESYIILDKPGATYTYPYGIDGNNIVGWYTSSPAQGFVYNIPEPSTLALLIAGSVMFAAYLWRRRQQMQR